MIDQEFEEDPQIEPDKFLLSSPETRSSVDPETHSRLEALLQAAGKTIFFFFQINISYFH